MARQGDEWYILANPVSGGDKAARDRAKIQAALAAEGIRGEWQETLCPGDGSRLASEAAAAGWRRILVVGGDGSVHDAVNGLLAQETLPASEVLLGIIPTGTGCDWAKTYGIPGNYRKAAALLRQPKAVRQDAGRIQLLKGEEVIDEIFFNNVSGLAFDGFVVQKTKGLSKSGAGGTFFYLAGVLRCLFSYPVSEVEVRGEGLAWQGRALCVNVGICRYNGGGMQLVPEALPDDGLLDITVIEDIGPGGVLRNLYRLYNGSLYRHPRVHHFRSPWAEVEALPGAVPLEADGELLGFAPCRFEVMPGALRLVSGR
jgi:YegS/Rv2252/BmrU family lipid kinase